PCRAYPLSCAIHAAHWRVISRTIRTIAELRVEGIPWSRSPPGRFPERGRWSPEVPTTTRARGSHAFERPEDGSAHRTVHAPDDESGSGERDAASNRTRARRVARLPGTDDEGTRGRRGQHRGAEP